MSVLVFKVKVAVPDSIDLESVTEEDAENFGRFHIDSGCMRPDDAFYNAEFNVESVCFEELEEGV